MITTRGRYALRLMVDIAEQGSENFIPLKEIASRQQISEKYLEAILRTMVKNKLIVGVRGKGGGYKLTKPAEDYTVFEIVDPVEGDLAPVECLSDNHFGCHRINICKTIPVWDNLNKVIKNYLSSITLKDIVDGNITFPE